MLKRVLCILFVFALVVFLMYYNATNINTKQINVRKEILKSDKIDDDVDGLLIAYFSDLNYGNYIDNEFLDETIRKLNVFEPDLIIFGGDLFDNSVVQGLSQEKIDYLKESLSSLDAKYGKFAVYGDTDLYNKDLVTDLLNQADFTILDNSHHLISTDRNSAINIVGTQPYVNGTVDLNAAFSGINSDNYTIIISHCPDIFDEAENYSFDYMLSGHSRGGQVNLPVISFFTRDEGCKKYFSGKNTKNGKTIDITNGLGRIHSNARFMADAEIVFYTLNKPYSIVSDTQENK